MKKWKLLAGFAIVAAALLSFTGCALDNGNNCSHTWGGWETTKQTNCFAEGEQMRGCTSCGKTETRAIAMQTTGCGNPDCNHSIMTEWRIQRQATCTEEGEEVRNCTAGNCDKIERRAISMLTVGCNDNGNNDFVDVPTEGKNADQLIRDGNAALRRGNYDEAVAFYEAAFRYDNNHPKAIIYSTLANIARISTDPKVGDLLRNRFGFTNYPNRLNALFSNEWLTTYQNEWIQYSYFDNRLNTWVYWKDRWYLNNPTVEGVNQVGYHREIGRRLVFVSNEWKGDSHICRWDRHTCLDWYENSSWISQEFGFQGAGYYYWIYTYQLVSTTPIIEEGRNILLPGLQTPSWIVGGNDSWYNQSLTSGGVPSFQTWSLLLFANLVDRNTEGLNRALDETIAAVFGDSFNRALDRIKRLENRKDARINLDRDFIEALSLDRFTPITEYDYIGWAEINAITSSMIGIRASLEWVAAYDWSYNWSFLKGHAWQNDEDYFLDRFKTINPRDLPFNNNFLKARPGKMATAKASFITAIRGIQASYTAILDSDLYPTAVKSAYPTLNEGIELLLDAIQNGREFWIPEDPTTGRWPTGFRRNVLFGIDMGNFFREGYFSLPNLFETDASGRPVFYTRNGTRLTLANYQRELDNTRDFIGFNFNTRTIKNVLLEVPELDRQPDTEILEMFPPEIAKILFEKFYR